MKWSFFIERPYEFRASSEEGIPKEDISAIMVSIGLSLDCRVFPREGLYKFFGR